MRRSPNGYNLEKSLGHLSARFTRTLLRRINTEFARQNLPVTAEQYGFLVQLWQQNGLPQGVLAEKTGKDKTTMARLAAGLEARGIITRLPSPSDARERQVYLTDKGKALMDQATGLVQALLQKAQQGIDPARLDICREVLRQATLNLLN